jgi:beta-phosphoglucomutase-like phosphatase (HAD superfamily)
VFEDILNGVKPAQTAGMKVVIFVTVFLNKNNWQHQ